MLLTISISSQTIVEPGGGQDTMVFTVTRTDGLDHSIQVSYQTIDGSAKANVDYLPQSGTITFGAGESSATIDVPILHNDAFVGPSSFSVQLTGIVSNPPNFAPAVNFSTNGGADNQAIGDFNHDGKMDVVVG